MGLKTSARGLKKENIVIPNYGFRREGARTKTHQPRYGFSASMETIRREHEMLTQTKSRKGKKLLLQEVEEYWGDVGRLAAIVHHADFPGLEKSKARR